MGKSKEVEMQIMSDLLKKPELLQTLYINFNKFNTLRPFDLQGGKYFLGLLSSGLFLIFYEPISL